MSFSSRWSRSAELGSCDKSMVWLAGWRALTCACDSRVLAAEKDAWRPTQEVLWGARRVCGRAAGRETELSQDDSDVSDGRESSLSDVRSGSAHASLSDDGRTGADRTARACGVLDRGGWGEGGGWCGCGDATDSW